MAKPTVQQLADRVEKLEKELAKVQAGTSAKSADHSQAIDDVCTVTAAYVDGDHLDSPDVAPCVHRLRLHREGGEAIGEDDDGNVRRAPLPGYPPRNDESEAEGEE